MSNSDSDIIERHSDFGSVLAEARKSQNYTIGEISEHIKIPAHVIAAIEANDIDALPAPTFTQGYIRTYAKFLEISEDSVLEIYNRVVPHDQATNLKPRSNLPDEANSQSPLVKTVTMLLIVAGIAAVIYGSFQYYQKKADVIESELESKERSFTGNSLDSPGAQGLGIKQDAPVTDDDELIAQDADSLVVEGDVAESEIIAEPVDESAEVEASTEADLQPEADESQDVTEAVAETEAVKKDTIEVFAEKGAWLEVYDASKTRLFYNMVPEGSSRLLTGQAPFRISLGNAKYTQLTINNIEIDMTNFIRSNNTAVFTVSTEDKNVIFH